MKKIITHTRLLVALCILFAVGCEKQMSQVYFDGGTAAVLTSSATTLPALSVADKNKTATIFSWTNPNYNFTTGISSQDVSYAIQFDTVGANFSSPTMQQLSVSKELTHTLTIGELNTVLTKMELAPDVPHDLEVRVVSTLVNTTVPLSSNVIKYTAVVPYEDFAIVPPASNQLYIVGDATPAGWGNPVPEASQKLTTVQKGIYEITLALNGGKSYLFLPVNGSWDAKYGAMGANGTNNPDGDAFKLGGGDLISPATSGNYKITVDFKTGKFKVIKQ